MILDIIASLAMSFIFLSLTVTKCNNYCKRIELDWIVPFCASWFFSALGIYAFFTKLEPYIIHAK